MLKEVLRERFSPVTHSRLWVSPPSSCDFYSLGSMQGQPADQSQRTLGGREGKGREAGGRQRDTEETTSTDSRNGASLLTLCYLAADCCTTAETMKGGRVSFTPQARTSPHVRDICNQSIVEEDFIKLLCKHFNEMHTLVSVHSH